MQRLYDIRCQSLAADLRFYKSSILYLAFTPLEAIPVEECPAGWWSEPEQMRLIDLSYFQEILLMFALHCNVFHINLLYSIWYFGIRPLLNLSVLVLLISLQRQSQLVRFTMIHIYIPVLLNPWFVIDLYSIYCYII